MPIDIRVKSNAFIFNYACILYHILNSLLLLNNGKLVKPTKHTYNRHARRRQDLSLHPPGELTARRIWNHWLHLRAVDRLDKAEETI